MVNPVHQAITDQWWDLYRPGLQELSGGIESAFDWYNLDTIRDQRGEDFVGDSTTEDQLRDMMPHVLYRVASYQKQPYTLVARFPAPKIREVKPDEDLRGDYERELQKLQQDITLHQMNSKEKTSVPVKSISKVTSPNWSQYLYRRAWARSEDRWSKRFGTLWREIDKVSNTIDIPKNVSEYFSIDNPEQGIFGDFYYTNRFKLPWPRGEDPPDPPFAEESIDNHCQQEITAAAPNLIITLGASTFSMVKRIFTVEDDVPDRIKAAHGSLFKVYLANGETTYWLPVVHPGSRYIWRTKNSNEAKEPLKTSLRTLADKGII